MLNRDRADLSEFKIFETAEFAKKLDKLSRSESSTLSSNSCRILLALQSPSGVTGSIT